MLMLLRRKLKTAGGQKIKTVLLNKNYIRAFVPLLQKFISNSNAKNLFTKKDRLLVATSGGIDSVVLCKLCSLAGYEFGIAHCNFQLRGADAERDEDFVKEFAADIGVPFYSVKFDTKKFAAENKVSTQVAARDLRYGWFEKIRIENNYDYILTAHHADDNVETMLMSFFRGTGIKGLIGIKEKKGSIIRPLLFAKRKELEGFLQQHQLSFVQDESNLHDDYTRNYFRNTVLPLITKSFPEVQDNLLANIDRFKDVDILYRQSIDQHKKKLLTLQGNDIYIPVLLLKKAPAFKTVLFEILSEYDFSAAQVPEVMALLESESGRYVLSSSHRVLKDRKHLIVSPVREKEVSFVVIENKGKYFFANGAINIDIIEEKNFEIPVDARTACVDASKVKFPLILRPWRTGDYFYPLGMPKKKKLSRFFIDKKLSLTDKEKIWVLESDKKIIWVVGQRIDDRVKVRETTQKILRISFSATT